MIIINAIPHGIYLIFHYSQIERYLKMKQNMKICFET